MSRILKPLIYAALGCMVFVTFGCHKNDSKNTQPSYNPTPYIFSGNLPDYVPPPESKVPADNPETVQGVELGRFLFYDSIMSKDYHHACASCHQQRYAFTDHRSLSLGMNDSVGKFNSMALFNILWERPGFFWNARAPILDSQIVQPVVTTFEMDLPWDSVINRLQKSPIYPNMFNKAFGSTTVTKERAVKAIAQFLRTIVSYSSKYDSFQEGLVAFDSSERLGYQLFTSDPVANTNPSNKTVGLNHRLPGTGIDCFHCHSNPDFVPELLIPDNQTLQNDGLGTINLKVPSLRNLKFSAPYMSDGKFMTLDSVINHYDHGVDPKPPTSPLMYAIKYTTANATQLATPHMELSAKEKAGLVDFLNTLNDYSLITNPAYSNPFIK